jgi:hypothetical protein
MQVYVSRVNSSAFVFSLYHTDTHIQVLSLTLVLSIHN